MTWPTPYRPQPDYMRDTPELVAARRAVLDELKPCSRKRRAALAADWRRTCDEREAEARS